MKKNYRYSLMELARRLFIIAGPEKKYIIAATLASIIGNLSHMGLMGFGSALILFSAGWLDGGSLPLWGGLTLLCALLIGVMRFYEGVESHVAAYELLAGMRVNLYHSLRRLAPACLVDREKGDILSVAIADIDTIENFFAHTIGPLFTVILLPLTALLYAGSVHILFAAALFPMYLIISVGIPLLAMGAGRSIGAKYRAEIGCVKSLVLESIYGLKDIQIFGFGERRLTEIREKGRAINKAAHAMTIHRQLVTALPTFFIYLSRILIVMIAAHLTLTQQAQLSGIIILSFVVSASFSSTQSLISVVSSLLETFAAAERYFEIQDELPAVTELPDAKELTTISKLEFKHLYFRYRADGRDILRDIQFHISSGDKIGIVGESGIGKSTILRLLLRFWDPVRGSVLLNGEDIRTVKLADLRRRIAMLEQTTFLYNDTIAANIALGKPDASQEEIIAAAKRAGIHRAIEALPDGYDTPMGEQGSRLSGGEKQRIGIARIMLIDPDVIVMDEPTSNLDVFHEKLLLKTLEDEYHGKTIIIVSHRNSTLTGCDRIYKLDQGALKEIASV